MSFFVDASALFFPQMACRSSVNSRSSPTACSNVNLARAFAFPGKRYKAFELLLERFACCFNLLELGLIFFAIRHQDPLILLNRDPFP